MSPIRVLLILQGLVTIAFAQTATIDLGLRREPGRKLLWEQTLLHDLKMKVAGPGGSQEFRQRSRVTVKAVDWYAKRAADGADFEGYRRYLAFEQDEGGQVTDLGLNGVTFHYLRTGNELRAGPQGRLVDATLRAREFTRAMSLGGWIPLPGKTAVGQRHDVGFVWMATALLDLDSWPDRAVASLVLEKIDRENGVAILAGKLEVDATVRPKAGSLKASYKGDLRMTVDLNAGRLADLDFTGTLATHGKIRKTPTNGTGKVHARLRIKDGVAAERALKRKPRYRAARRDLDEIGIGFELPSHWVDEGRNLNPKLGWAFGTNVDGPKKLRRLFFAVFPSSDGKTEAKKGAQQIADARKGKVRQVSTRLGRAHEVEFVDGDGALMIMNMIPFERGVIRVSLNCLKSERKAALKDLARVRKSVRPHPIK